MPDTPRPVHPADHAALLTALDLLPGTANEGFFGPHSITWTINRECAVFLGAGRAALLQLAHPWVAAALADHSNMMGDAIGRFHSTFRVVYTMLFGSRAQASAASRQLYNVHTSIQGTLPTSAGAYPAHQHYQANEVAALRWVFATLVESAILAYETALPPLRPADREIYYHESQRMAALCGIPATSLPSTWVALRQYTQGMMTSSELAVTEPARRMGQAVLTGVGTWVQAPEWYKALTTSWLSPQLRDGFALPFGPAEKRRARQAVLWLPRLYPRMPKRLRYVGPYHEAEARLCGHKPDRFTQASNRFWMGRARLLFPE